MQTGLSNGDTCNPEMWLKQRELELCNLILSLADCRVQDEQYAIDDSNDVQSKCQCCGFASGCCKDLCCYTARHEVCCVQCSMYGC